MFSRKRKQSPVCKSSPQGFEGSTEVVVLEAGTQIDRYGSEDGYFTAAIDTPYEQRSCAPGSNQKPYHQYEMLKPIEGVEQGITVPWFDEPGGSVQYIMPPMVPCSSMRST